MIARALELAAGFAQLPAHVYAANKLTTRQDDIYMYDRRLSVSEISTLYTAAIPEPTTGLLLGLGLLGVAVRRRSMG